MDAQYSQLDAQGLFVTPLLSLMVDTHERLNKALKAKILSKQALDEGINRSNLGGWHSDSDMIGWAREEAGLLLQIAVDASTKYTADISTKGKRDFQFAFDMWANVNMKTNANKMHAHPGALWSGVYYVDDGYVLGGEDQGGELMLEDPRYPMNGMYKPDLVFRNTERKAQHTQHVIKPKTGMMVMFPSWLRHSVRPYLGDGQRISVAFNMQVVEA